jgi:hypothetical protein
MAQLEFAELQFTLHMPTCKFGVIPVSRSHSCYGYLSIMSEQTESYPRSIRTDETE